MFHTGADPFGYKFLNIRPSKIILPSFKPVTDFFQVVRGIGRTSSLCYNSSFTKYTYSRDSNNRGVQIRRGRGSGNFSNFDKQIKVQIKGKIMLAKKGR